MNNIIQEASYPLIRGELPHLLGQPLPILKVQSFFELISNCKNKETQIDMDTVKSSIITLSREIPGIIKYDDIIRRCIDIRKTSKMQIESIIKKIKFPNDILYSRRDEIETVLRWIIPFIIDSRYTIMFNIIIVINSGHGMTYMAETIYSCLNQTNKAGTHLAYYDKYVKDSPFNKNSLNIIECPSNKIGIYEGNCSVIALCDLSNFSSIKKELENHSTTFVLRAEDITPIDLAHILSHELKIKDSNYSSFSRKVTDLCTPLFDAKFTPRDIINIIRVSLKNTGAKSINPNSIYALASYVTEYNRLPEISISNVVSKLRNAIIGQDHVIKEVASVLRIVKYGLADRNKPVMSALFLGPTGTGKTSFAKALSECIFGKGKLVRQDLTEFTEAHYTSKFFGSPPGYIGYGNDPEFVKQIKANNCNCVILFDEFDKAHENVQKALMNIIDVGRLTTGDGIELDLTNTIIIITSNALSEIIGKKMKLGFKGEEEQKSYTPEEVKELLISSKKMKSEIINRFQIVEVFSPLTNDIATIIIRKELNNFKNDLRIRNIVFSYNNKLVNNIVSNYDKSWGGRDIERLIGKVKSLAIQDIINGKVKIRGRF